MPARLCATVLFLLFVSASAEAFLEDVCLPRVPGQSALTWCVRPKCALPTPPDRACVAQMLDFATIQPGRSTLHADATYFIAQSLGYRADVAYWIAAYDEVSDYGQYIPIDQCGVQASASNSGRNYITAAFNGFQRTNGKTDGPLDHYVVSFSPNGQGTDVHGAGGVQALYPLHYPLPGYPTHIDDTYQKTLANMRQWAMLPTGDRGLLCTAGLTSDDGVACLDGINIKGTVPLTAGPSDLGVDIDVPAGRKVLDIDDSGQVTYYEQLQSWLADASRTTGRLWKDPAPGQAPVPVQIARVGLYLHTLQDASSHATYCGDNAPSPPGGGDAGTYMSLTPDAVLLSFGNSCAASPHVAGHVQETGTGDHPLPLRDYVALNNTIDELIAFGNDVASRYPGWIVNPELLPPDVVGGRNGQGASAADIKAELAGTIIRGTAFSRAEVYKSGLIASALQKPNALDRVRTMTRALNLYSKLLRQRSKNPAQFIAFEPMPGYSYRPNDTSVCWK